MTQQTDVPVIIAQTGALAGQRWLLNEGELLVGRSGDCQVLVNDKTVSRHHARLFRQDGGWAVEDLSKNGTYVNDQPVEGMRMLADGDVVAISTAVKLVFVGSEATVPLTIDVQGERRLRIDTAARRVFVNNMELDPPLSLPQYRLLELLYHNQGQVCTREQVVNTVWPDAETAGVSEQSIDALVRRLRDRLSEVDPEHMFIVTVRGHGFRLENPPAG